MFWYILAALIVVLFIAARIARVRLVRVTVYEFQRALRYRKGRFLSVLGPGQYWILEPRTTVTPVDVRPHFITLMGQEVLTADGVPLKVSVAANYEMSDPQLAINGQANYAQALYLLLQLAVREVISSSKADELLDNRAGFADKIRALADPQVQRLGLKLITADLKDLMISGDLKRSFAQVVKARKEGEAALERARGETAALRPCKRGPDVAGQSAARAVAHASSDGRIRRQYARCRIARRSAARRPNRPGKRVSDLWAFSCLTILSVPAGQSAQSVWMTRLRL